MNPLPIVAPSALSDAFCDDVIKLASHLPEIDAMTESGEVNSSIRRSKARWILPNPDSQFIFSVLDQMFRDMNRNCFGFDLDYIPEIQFTEYDASYEGNFDWHIDNIAQGHSVYSRKLSMTIQLSPSTSYEGGNLLFRGKAELPVEEIRPRGTVVVFPSFLEHCVTPVTQGRRLSLVAWIEGPNFR